MLGLLRVLPVALPAAEIAIMIVVADQIGIGWTLLALAGSAVLGGVVIRVLGAASLAELQAAIARRETPTGPLFRGACVLVAGMLLILPGFLSDVVAVLLLIPPTRTALAGALWRRWRGADGAHAHGGPTVIDGDYREVEPEHPERRLDDRSDDADQRR